MALLKRGGRGLKGAGGRDRSMHPVGEALVTAFNDGDWEAVLDIAFEFAPDLFEDEDEE